jgi:hypothetical protein
MFELILKYGWNKYWKYRKYWKKKMKGDVCDSFISFSMFYYPEDIGDIEHREMESGKTGIYKVIDVRGIDDWGSKDIKKDFIGYIDIKPIRECTLAEFMELYPTYLN